MTKIQTSIIQTVKDELDISENIEATELYDLLFKYRNSQHPDKFTDDERKKEAEEKFKSISKLLEQLASFIELEKQQKKPHEVIPFEKTYESIQNVQQIIKYEKEIESLKLSISLNEITIKDLKKEINKLTSDKLDQKIIDLIELYKPSKRSLFSLGIIFLLTLLAGALTKVDEIANLLNKYSPLDPKIFNYLIFFTLIYIPIRYLKMIYEESKIENVAKKIKTPLSISKYVNYLDSKGKSDKFTEMDVFDYLMDILIPKNIFSRIFFSKVLHIYSETTIDSLKDIFIFNLLNKKLITISNADLLDRKFKMVKAHRYFDDQDDFPF